MRSGSTGFNGEYSEPRLLARKHYGHCLRLHESQLDVEVIVGESLRLVAGTPETVFGSGTAAIVATRVCVLTLRTRRTNAPASLGRICTGCLDSNFMALS